MAILLYMSFSELPFMMTTVLWGGLFHSVLFSFDNLLKVTVTQSTAWSHTGAWQHLRAGRLAESGVLGPNRYFWKILIEQYFVCTLTFDNN